MNNQTNTSISQSTTTTFPFTPEPLGLVPARHSRRCVAVAHRRSGVGFERLARAGRALIPRQENYRRLRRLKAATPSKASIQAAAHRDAFVLGTVEQEQPPA